ncbi:secreted protein [Dactylonectria estremocensis]|uniref:Secreted protein n=1 Tax=Dactylonectria estremocensis TaxID=1079267 RepID=A0A9P9E5S3_9HYPO|nr:secreted protein [Dactylonectria estremocensis]
MGQSCFKRGFGWATAVALFGLAIVTNASLSGDGSTGPPKAIRPGATFSEIIFQPVLDFDKDGCYNVPAIDVNGNIDKGLNEAASNWAKDCRDASDLDNSQVYSRGRCNHGWCVIIFDYYFEKDGAITGHRYDWEHIAVWITNYKPAYVSVSQHGKWLTKIAADVRFEGLSPKIVYHKDGAGTHNFRFATAGDEPPENHRGKWIKGSLLSYGGWPNNGLRDKLMNWGSFKPANIAIKDGSFQTSIMNTKPQHITFDPNVHDPSILHLWTG